MNQETSKNSGKVLTLTSNFVKDYFYHKNNKIVILENKAFKNIDANILILAKVIEDGNNATIVPLGEEEYEQAIIKYDALINIFNEEEDKNNG